MYLGVVELGQTKTKNSLIDLKPTWDNHVDHVLNKFKLVDAEKV